MGFVVSHATEEVGSGHEGLQCHPNHIDITLTSTVSPVYTMKTQNNKFDFTV